MAIDLEALAKELSTTTREKIEVKYSPSRNTDILRIGSFIVTKGGRIYFNGALDKKQLAQLDIIRRRLADAAQDMPR